MASIQELKAQIQRLELERFKALRESGSIGAYGGNTANVGTREAIRRENKERLKQIEALERQVREMQGTIAA